MTQEEFTHKNDSLSSTHQKLRENKNYKSRKMTATNKLCESKGHNKKWDHFAGIRAHSERHNRSRHDMKDQKKKKGMRTIERLIFESFKFNNLSIKTHSH